MSMYTSIQEERYLAHHGIKGMKWYHRRFQNEDGTLTSEGKKRYLNQDGTLNKAGREKTLSEGNTKLAAKHKNEFTNDELDQIMKRFEKKADFDKKISDFESEEVTRKMEKANKVLNTTKNVLDTTVKVTSAGISLYNAGVAVNNTFSNNKKKSINLNGWFDGNNRSYKDDDKK